MAARSVTVLVTGFGPFPGCHSNPTGELARWIDDGLLRAPEGSTLLSRTLETSWRAVREFAEGPLQDIAPDISLHFGVSGRAGGFRIETVARNTASNSADCDGETFDGAQLVRGAGLSLRTSLNARQLAVALRRRGLPAETSRDAGDYLCNMIMFLSLHEGMRAGRAGLCGFVHIPPFRSAEFTRKDLLIGVDLLIRSCVSRLRHAEVTASRRICC